MQKSVCIASAIKLIKDLEAEKADLLANEVNGCMREEVNGEVVDECEYSFADTQCRLTALDESVRNIRHAINVANATIPITALGMTPDCVLVTMAAKNQRLDRLQTMVRTPRRKRCETYGGTQNVYKLRNFDLAEVKAAAEGLRREVRDLQLELDKHNLNTEISFDLV